MEERRYNVGDMVNGHVWTGTAWVPVNAVPVNAAPQPPQIGTVENGHRWDGSRWVAEEPAGYLVAGAAPKPWYRTTGGIVGIGLTALVGVLLIASIGSGDGESGTRYASQEQGSGTTTAPAPAPKPTPTRSAAAPAPTGSERVNDWTVRVVEVNRDASAAIEDANSFNSDPDYGYIIVTLEGVNGAATVKDLQSFTVKFQGSDKVVYSDESLFMVMPQDIATEAAPGGTVRAQFVFDVPASALGAGALVMVDSVPVGLS